MAEATANDLSELILRNVRRVRKRIAFRMLGSLALAATSFYGETPIERILFWVGAGGTFLSLMLMSPLFGEHLQWLLQYARTEHTQIAWIELLPMKRGHVMVWLRSVDKEAWPIMMQPADAEALAARWSELVPGLFVGPSTPERHRAWRKDPSAPLHWTGPRESPRRQTAPGCATSA